MLSEVKSNLYEKGKLIKKYAQGKNGISIGIGLLLLRRIYIDLINHFFPLAFPELIVFPSIALVGIGAIKLVYGIIKSIIYKNKLKKLENEEKKCLENAIDYVTKLEKENQVFMDNNKQMLNDRKNNLNMLKQSILKQEYNLPKDEEIIKTK